MIISGADDKKIIFWQDYLYSFEYMPLQATVMHACSSEVGEYNRLKNWIKCYGDSIMIENITLFFWAIENKDRDFLQLFENQLEQFVIHSGDIETDGEPDREPKRISLLQYAIKKGDLDCLLIVLKCWAKALGKDMSDPLLQTFFHPSYWIRKIELKSLAREFPFHFYAFLREIKLVKAPEVPLKTKFASFDGTRLISTTNKKMDKHM